MIAGVDEVGRGCIAGNVVAAAVVLGEAPIEGLNDSKKLSPKRREALANLIRSHATAWAIGEASVAEIDALNISQASLLAMSRAVQGLPIRVERVLVDGNQVPDALAECGQAIIGGDAIEPAIMAASIIAKVHRDRAMCELDMRYPHYGLARHKGYPTKAHLSALSEHGVPLQACIYRTSYAPVARLLRQEGT